MKGVIILRQYNVEISDNNDKAEKRKKRKKRLTRTAILSAILIPCIIFGGIMYRGYVKTNEAYDNVQRDYTNLAMSYVTTDATIDSEDKNMNRKVDFTSLMKKEKDIYAWVYIPNTSIDYPILQSDESQSDDDYWLNHNLDGSEGYPGTIFTERMFGKDFKTFNTVIYGHNMKNQTMFGGLHNFENSDYFNKHNYVYIYTPNMTYKYIIVSASTISDIHLALAYNGYETEQQRNQFLDYLQANSVKTRENVKTGIYDSYITLSTCTSSDVNRFVVLAKCVDKISDTDFD